MSSYSQSFQDDAPVGYAIPAAYQVDGALGLACSHCGAEPGAWCVVRGVVQRIPCMPRLGEAYRTNNPRGVQQHAERQAYLAEHRRTYQAPWRNVR